MVIEVSEKTKEAMSDVIRLYGYRSEKEFIEDALRRRILDLKQMDFLRKARTVREGLAKRGLTEKDILEDFDKFYHQR